MGKNVSCCDLRTAPDLDVWEETLHCCLVLLWEHSGSWGMLRASVLWISALRSCHAVLGQWAEPFLGTPVTPGTASETTHPCSTSMFPAGMDGERRPGRDAAVRGKQNKPTASFLLGAVRKAPGGELISAVT